MRLRALFGIVAVLAIVVFLFISVEGRRSESCQCFYVGECQYDENNVGYKYYMCRGACVGYSDWRVDSRCFQPKLVDGKVVNYPTP